MKAKLLFMLTTLCMFAALATGCQQEMPNNGTGIEKETEMVITVDPTIVRSPVKNIFSDMNMWDLNAYWTTAAETMPDDFFATRYPFVKTMQLMTATGGNASRDLFVDPENRDVLDDYDFTPLIAACRNVVRQGLKPMIKTGNVPMKYSTDPIEIGFGVNVRPPDDYEVYYDYIHAIAEALLEEFGAAEMSGWSWGVLTEYENRDWFVARDESETREAYCKLYDYTVAALQDVLGRENLTVGAHSMTCSEGIWNEEEFIEHCARGTNYKTGETGTQLDFLAASYYDMTPGNRTETNLSLTNTMGVLQNAARHNGLTGLRFGVDEGRIIAGPDGKELGSRVVAHTFQASSDAAMFKLMNELDADWFSAWAVNTGDVWGSVDLVGTHLANLCYKMTGSPRAGFDVEGRPADSSNQVDGMATYDAPAEKLCVLLYNYNADMGSQTAETPVVTISNVRPVGSGITVTQWVIDDTHGNFWPTWESDMQARGINTDSFSWSMYSTNPLQQLISEGDREYWKSREAGYAALAKMTPTSLDVSVTDNTITLTPTLEHHAVVFYEITNIQSTR